MKISTLALMSMWGGTRGFDTWGMGAYRPKADPPRAVPRKHACQLPGCAEITVHNGGYCCAEHCRQHRAQRKQDRRT